MKTIIKAALIIVTFITVVHVGLIELQGIRAERFLTQQCEAGNLEACKK